MSGGNGQPATVPHERTLPHSLDAERAVLGAILLHNDAYELIARTLTSGHFFRNAHRLIYASIVRVLEQPDQAVDLLTLKTDLGRHGELEEVGGPAYLAALIDGVPRSTNIEHYAQIVEDTARLRAMIGFSNWLLTEAYLGEEPARVLLNNADRRLLALQGHDQGGLIPLETTSPALLEDLEYRVAHKGELTGVDTGFKSVNQLTMGWQAGDLIIIAARPSIGKTTFVINTAVEAARTGARVAFFSLEMTRLQLEYRILASLSKIPLARLLAGYVLSDVEWTQLGAAVAEMGRLSLSIDDTPGRTVWDVRGACRRMKAEGGGLDLVVIDYVQLMPGTLERRGATRNEEVTDISRRLKTLAGELHVGLLLLSQLNRGAEGRVDPKPKLQDLRESGSLEQDADLVCFLHRKDHRAGGTTSFILEKQRNGPTGQELLTLDREITLFTDGGEPEPEPTPEERAEKKAKAAGRRRRAHSQ